MATIYRRIGGRKLTKVIATHAKVQETLDAIALKHGILAEANLRAHEDTGASRITIEEGDVDRYVVLDDDRGQDAAMSIEFGRQLPDGRRSDGAWALHDAFGLPHGGGE